MRLLVWLRQGIHTDSHLVHPYTRLGMLKAEASTEPNVRERWSGLAVGVLCCHPLGDMHLGSG